MVMISHSFYSTFFRLNCILKFFIKSRFFLLCWTVVYGDDFPVTPPRRVLLLLLLPQRALGLLQDSLLVILLLLLCKVPFLLLLPLLLLLQLLLHRQLAAITISLLLLLRIHLALHLALELHDGPSGSSHHFVVAHLWVHCSQLGLDGHRVERLHLLGSLHLLQHHWVGSLLDEALLLLLKLLPSLLPLLLCQILIHLVLQQGVVVVNVPHQVLVLLHEFGKESVFGNCGGRPL